MNKYIIMISLFGLACIVSCQKSALPTDENFTDCENCTFTYQEHGEIVFSFREYWDGKKNSSSPYRGLLFEVSAGSTAFDYGKEEITSDKVSYQSMCVYCDVVPLQPVDGKITGKKVDDHRWLVEANVVLAVPNLDVRDTMTFKQYFTKGPDIIPNP